MVEHGAGPGETGPAVSVAVAGGLGSTPIDRAADAAVLTSLTVAGGAR